MSLVLNGQLVVTPDGYYGLVNIESSDPNSQDVEVLTANGLRTMYQRDTLKELPLGPDKDGDAVASFVEVMQAVQRLDELTGRPLQIATAEHGLSVLASKPDCDRQKLKESEDRVSALRENFARLLLGAFGVEGLRSLVSIVKRTIIEKREPNRLSVVEINQNGSIKSSQPAGPDLLPPSPEFWPPKFG